MLNKNEINYRTINLYYKLKMVVKIFYLMQKQYVVSKNLFSNKILAFRVLD